MDNKKIFYLDNLKVLLTALVVMHHSFVTYGAPGGWYYKEATTRVGALIPMTMFVATNQAFFMGFFFFLSAYFTRSSYDRKGPAQFVKDRLIRLGIPLLFYSFILSPFLSYLVYYFAQEHHISYWAYLSGFDGWIDFGVLWFVAALLLFTLLYVVWRVLAPREGAASSGVKAPGVRAILLFALGVGVVSFLVRVIFPVGWVLKPLGFQLGHFSQYVALFVLGIVASGNGWLDKLSDRTGKRLGWVVLLLILFFPVFYVIKEKLDMPLAWYSGGFHWQSLLYAVWEQVIGFSLIVTLLAWGKRAWNQSSVLLGRLSRCAFAAYIFHPLVLIAMSMAVWNWPVDPSIKLLIVTPLAVVGSFFLAMLVMIVPGVKKVI